MADLEVLSNKRQSLDYLPHDIFHYEVAVAAERVFLGAVVEDTAFVFGSDLQVCLQERLYDHSQLLVGVASKDQDLPAVFNFVERERGLCVRVLV